MTDMVPFVYGDQQVRTVLVDGEPWFVAADVARVLGYRDANHATRTVRSRDRGTHPAGTPNGLTIVSEPGLYRLIMRSDRPEADEFQDWVTHELLPAVRKTGVYGVERQLTRRELAQMVIDAEDRIAELEPAAEQFNRWQSSPDTVYVVEWAKTIGLTQREAYRALRECDVLFKQQHEGWAFNVPKRAYERYFHLIDEYLSGPRRWTKVPKITAEGQTVLAELLLENGWIAP